MRAKPFTFKKTKRVKTVTEHRAICVDLTEQDAADLRALLGAVECRETIGPAYEAHTELFRPLSRELTSFLAGTKVTPRIQVSTTPPPASIKTEFQRMR